MLKNEWARMINYRFLFKCTLLIIVVAFNMQKKVSGEAYSDVSGLSVVSDHNLRMDSGLTLKLDPDIVSPSYLLGEKISGITAMGIISFPAGPGKIKFGAGLVGSSPGFSMEASYGIRIGEMVEVRGGIRSTEALNAKTSASNELGRTGWMDGQIVLGVNL